MTEPVDYDFHGLAGIRLLEASDDDVAVVTSQIGMTPSSLDREPDITIRFVDRLAVSSRVRFLGVEDAGFTDDAFLVLRGKHKSRAAAQIPIDRIGKGCEIVCERGVMRVPLLVPIVNLTVLGNGALPLHASAFTYRDTGLLVTGWSKGGKTEALLAFMANGASYIGDEWVYVSGDGSRMYGMPEPVRVWKWHLDSMPLYRSVIRRADRAKLRVLGGVVGGIGRLTSRRSRHRSVITRTAVRVRALLAKQLYVDVSPYKLFGEDACRLSGTPQKILFVGSHEADEVTVRRIDPQEVARRMVFSLQEEQTTLTSYYWKFRFAFPEAANELIEGSRQLQSEALARVVDGRDAYEVLHPYPVRIPSLYDAIEERCLRDVRS